MATASPSRTSEETKARIVLVAQDVFSTKGYSHAGLREIAARAKVAPSLVIKYFGTKARLFEDALVAAIQPTQHFQQDRARVGEAIVAAVLDPQSRMQAPAMIALALGDGESRGIVERVVREQVLDPMTSWLGAGDAQVMAINILAMTMGFSILHRNMDHSLSAEERAKSGRYFAQSLQDLVDRA